MQLWYTGTADVGDALRILAGYFVQFKIRENTWARTSHGLKLYTATLGSIMIQFRRETHYNIVFYFLFTTVQKYNIMNCRYYTGFKKRDFSWFLIPYRSISWYLLFPIDSHRWKGYGSQTNKKSVNPPLNCSDTCKGSFKKCPTQNVQSNILVLLYLSLGWPRLSHL